MIAFAALDPLALGREAQEVLLELGPDCHRSREGLEVDAVGRAPLGRGAAKLREGVVNWSGAGKASQRRMNFDKA